MSAVRGILYEKMVTKLYFICSYVRLLAIFQAVSGLLMWLVIPRGGEGYQGGRGAELAEPTLLWSRHTTKKALVQNE